MTSPMNIEPLLEEMLAQTASDLYLTVGAVPHLKIHGVIKPIAFWESPLTEQNVITLIHNMIDGKLYQKFTETKELIFSIERQNLGRFRVNLFRQKNCPGAVLRYIQTKIPTLEELFLPPCLKEFSMIKRGLVLFAGGTGAGKSSSLAAIMGHRNQYGSGHIVTIEDPIEFVHQHNRCLITQREVGVDTDSFEVALKYSVRQAPDVILIGEIRTRETMEYAVVFAETGHLCLATLHANDAIQTLDRIVNLFPRDSHDQILLDLSLNLKAIVAQQLLPMAHQEGRRVAVEILLNTPLVAEHIRKGAFHLLNDVMKKSTEQGMQTFDQSLFALYEMGIISYEDALKHAGSENELRLMIKLSQKQDAQGNKSLSGVSVLKS